MSSNMSLASSTHHSWLTNVCNARISRTFNCMKRLMTVTYVGALLFPYAPNPNRCVEFPILGLTIRDRQHMINEPTSTHKRQVDASDQKLFDAIRETKAVCDICGKNSIECTLICKKCQAASPSGALKNLNRQKLQCRYL